MCEYSKVVGTQKLCGYSHLWVHKNLWINRICGLSKCGYSKLLVFIMWVFKIVSLLVGI